MSNSTLRRNHDVQPWQCSFSHIVGPTKKQQVKLGKKFGLPSKESCKNGCAKSKYIFSYCFCYAVCRFGTECRYGDDCEFKIHDDEIGQVAIGRHSNPTKVCWYHDSHLPFWKEQLAKQQEQEQLASGLTYGPDGEVLPCTTMHARNASTSSSAATLGSVDSLKTPAAAAAHDAGLQQQQPIQQIAQVPASIKDAMIEQLKELLATAQQENSQLKAANSQLKAENDELSRSNIYLLESNAYMQQESQSVVVNLKQMTKFSLMLEQEIAALKQHSTQHGQH